MGVRADDLLAVCGVGKHNETKAPAAARVGILHDGAVCKLAKLLEVVLQAVLRRLPAEAANEHFTVLRRVCVWVCVGGGYEWGQPSLILRGCMCAHLYVRPFVFMYQMTRLLTVEYTDGHLGLPNLTTSWLAKPNNENAITNCAVAESFRRWT